MSTSPLRATSRSPGTTTPGRPCSLWPWRRPCAFATLQTTDGPFAETKEQLGGLYLIDAKDLNEAIQIASRIPSCRYGSVEIRPVVDFSQGGTM